MGTLEHIGNEPPLTEYQSVLRDWDRLSAVRSKPRRLVAEREEGKSFFSEALTPIAAHPLVATLGPEVKDELLTRKLGSYMDFTIGLEQDIVNPVLLELARGRPAALPQAIRLDTNRIYCDEAYHALSAFDLKWQVEQYTGISMPPVSEPRFGRALRDAKQKVPCPMYGLVDLCATVVSETLISSTLSKVPADTTIISAIRESVADHAADERTHHAFFTKVFETIWPTLDGHTQHLLGPLLGELIVSFLAPDVTVEAAILCNIGFGCGDAEQIVAESHPAARVAGVVRYEARATLRLMNRLGVLDDSQTLAHFQLLGLASPPGDGS